MCECFFAGFLLLVLCVLGGGGGWSVNNFVRGLPRQLKNKLRTS